jgi:hypothetical protein
MISLRAQRSDKQGEKGSERWRVRKKWRKK